MHPRITSLYEDTNLVDERSIQMPTSIRPTRLLLTVSLAAQRNRRALRQRMGFLDRSLVEMIQRVCVFIALTVPAASALAALSAVELAKLAQNPVGNLVSVPFQNDTNFNTGPQNGTQNILNIQPVIPISVSKDWNVITRTIVPVISQPGFSPGQSRVNGLGDIQLSGFLSPATPKGGLIWGVGAIAQLPTNTDDRLGNDRWGLGPTAVVLHLEHGDPWVYKALANNVWSVSGSNSSPSYNNFLLQPFLIYNFHGGLYLTSSPIVTADWEASGGQRWTVLLGGGVGKIFHLDKLPINSQVSAYYNVVRPDIGAEWQLRVQVQFMFPK